MANCLKWRREFLNFAITAFLFTAVVYICAVCKYFLVCEVICCLTPLITVILENLRFSQLIRNFPASTGAITVQRTRH